MITILDGGMGREGCLYCGGACFGNRKQNQLGF